MKRIVSVSAGLIAGLIASAAIAQGTDTGPTGAPPAPPAGAGISVGTSATTVAPKKDTATPAPAAEEKKKERRFAGSQMFMQTTANLNTFFPALQPYQNTTIDASIWLMPRFAINDTWQLRGRLIFSYEFTNSDTTTTKNEPRFSDSTVQLFYRKIPKVAGIGLNPFAQVTLPTSPESQARSMYFAPGLGLQAVRSFEHVLGGELSTILTAAYSHPFYHYTTAGLNDPPKYAPQCFGGSGCTEQVSGTANVSDSLGFIFLAAQEWGKWSPAVFFMLTNQWAYTFKDLEGVSRIEDRTSFRQSTYFSAWLDYNANEWFSAEVGYFMGRNILRADGKLAGPQNWIYDQTQDNRVYLGVNLNLDNIAKLIDGEKGKGGIVRAKNTHGPMMQY